MIGRATTIEVFADIGCPFAHISLRRFAQRRAALGRDEVQLHVRAWPLELVNGTAPDPEFIAAEIDEMRPQVAPDLFTGFVPEAFPATSLPALALEAAAYRHDPRTGEAVSFELRDRLFEHGQDVADRTVLTEVAERHGIAHDLDDDRAPRLDHEEGGARGVIGSPHFFTPTGSFFCPALEVRRDDTDHLIVHADPSSFDRFLASCFP